MGLFTSLLCCGSNANDSADDKYKQTPSNAASKERRGRNSAPSISANVPESEHSLSEIDKPVATIVNKSALNNRKSALVGKPLPEMVTLTDSELPNVVVSDRTGDSKLHTGKETSVLVPLSSGAATIEKSAAKTEDVNASAPNSEQIVAIDKSDAEICVESKKVSKDDSWAHDDEAEPTKESTDSKHASKVPEDAQYADEAEDTEDMDTKISDNSEDEEDDDDDDDDSPIDLTKIQKGQTFHPETGLLLGPKDTARFGNKKCLILDLDETLVHSSFKYLRTADFVIPVEIDNQVHHVYVIKRPGVDEFLRKVGKWYEVVVFTASVAKYGDPLLNKLDIHDAVHHRLFRDSCYSYQGNFIKNLSQIGRPLADSIIIDNSPASYIFHPQHSVPISSWFSDTHDNELLDLLPLLEDLSKPKVDDVSLVLDITI